MSATCGLHFLIGKKGAGKSMMAAGLAWKTIKDTRRSVVTNLPVKWDGLAELMETYGLPMSEVIERVTVIEDLDDLQRFWLIRGNGWGIPEVGKEAWKRGQRTDYRRCFRWKPTIEATTRCKIQDLAPKEIDDLLSSGELEAIPFGQLPAVAYYVDEIQNIFPAREWQNTAPSLLWHLSQQRKLSDEIYAMSQRPTLMDKQFRELADDWLFITNFGKLRRGLWRLPSAMGWAQYDELPGPGSEPMVRGVARFKIQDVGKTYDTSAGTGIAGNLLADTAETASGMNWKLGAIVMIALLIGLWFVPGIIIKGATRWTHRTTGEALASKKPKAVESSTVAATPGAAVKTYTMPTRPLEITNSVKRQEPKLTGITTMYGRCMAFFSDGEVVSTPSRRIGGLIRDGAGRIEGIKIDGKERYLGR